MNPEAGVRYRINQHDQITFVDDAWEQFAQANEAADLTGGHVLGRALWEFICDSATRQVYAQVLERVRRGRLTRFTLRCDAPTCRRLLEMTVRADGPNAVKFTTRTILFETHARLPLVDRNTPRSVDLLRTCGWCNRVEDGHGGWAHVEDAVARLRLFEAERMPRLSHGICGGCLQKMMATESPGRRPGAPARAGFIRRAAPCVAANP